jgi:RimJ/RimL family protein N-acetyltransferase
MSFKNKPETARLTLRPPAPGGFEAAHSWPSDPENNRYMAWGPNSEAGARKHLENARPGAGFVAALRGLGKVIGRGGGGASIPEGADAPAEIGWILSKRSGSGAARRSFPASLVAACLRT